MVYKFSSIEEKEEHYRKMHILSCKAFNDKNKEIQKVKRQEKTKSLNKERIYNNIFKMELIRFACTDRLFCIK